MISTARIYFSKERDGRYRILVDRLWPRGVSKALVHLDLWLKEVAPSDKLRQWFNHDPAKWETFKKRYFKELDKNKPLVDGILLKAQKHSVVLLYAAKDEEHNNAVALKEYLDSKLGSS